ncbi:hypothetical protein [Peptostreptococcus equinus]|uniref:DUF4352 domain-containing protein n=1 Tax=Peptostreptococcus equinus TaxID=3003601 RepID=A0ABY7JTE2_9FIRM|nr:hypothetical protein [Peptostreptococcus sp. CBA3647]WAW15240.1 hypothetical protein O0R46_01975 [Peptostreptococcus sp. CBA3647]
MKFNKKVLAIILCSSISLTAVGCGSSNSSSDNTSSSQTEEKKESNVKKEDEGTYTLIEDRKNANIEQTQGPIKFTINSIKVSSFKPDEHFKDMYKNKDELICLELDTMLENSSDNVIDVIPISSKLVLQDNSQIELDSLKTKADTSSLQGKAKAPSKLVFYIPQSEVPNIVTLHCNAPADLNSESFQEFKPFKIDINLK